MSQPVPRRYLARFAPPEPEPAPPVPEVVEPVPAVTGVPLQYVSEPLSADEVKRVTAQLKAAHLAKTGKREEFQVSGFVLKPSSAINIGVDPANEDDAYFQALAYGRGAAGRALAPQTSYFGTGRLIWTVGDAAVTFDAAGIRFTGFSDMAFGAVPRMTIEQFTGDCLDVLELFRVAGFGGGLDFTLQTLDAVFQLSGVYAQRLGPSAYRLADARRTVRVAEFVLPSWPVGVKGD